MINTITLKEFKLYKLVSNFKPRNGERNYIIFSPKKDILFGHNENSIINCQCHFLISYTKHSSNNPTIGLLGCDKIEELTTADYLEVGQYLKYNELFKFNLKSMKLEARK